MNTSAGVPGSSKSGILNETALTTVGAIVAIVYSLLVLFQIYYRCTKKGLCRRFKDKTSDPGQTNSQKNRVSHCCMCINCFGRSGDITINQNLAPTTTQNATRDQRSTSSQQRLEEDPLIGSGNEGQTGDNRNTHSPGEQETSFTTSSNAVETQPSGHTETDIRRRSDGQENDNSRLVTVQIEQEAALTTTTSPVRETQTSDQTDDETVGRRSEDQGDGNNRNIIREQEAALNTRSSPEQDTHISDQTTQMDGLVPNKVQNCSWEYDIFLYYTKKTHHVDTLRKIMDKNKWNGVSLDSCPLGMMKTNFVAKTLKDGTPVVVLLISEEDSKEGPDYKMNMVFEKYECYKMAIMAVYDHPVSNPELAFKPLISAYIEDEDFESRFTKGIQHVISSRNNLTSNLCTSAIAQSDASRPPEASSQRPGESINRPPEAPSHEHSVFPSRSRPGLVECLSRDRPGKDWRKFASDKLGASQRDLDFWGRKEPADAARWVLDEWEKKGLSRGEFIDYSMKLRRQSLVDAVTGNGGID